MKNRWPGGVVGVFAFVFSGPVAAATVQTFGAGSAVATIDRSATFDSLTANNVVHLDTYSENGLSITTSGDSWASDLNLSAKLDPFRGEQRAMTRQALIASAAGLCTLFCSGAAHAVTNIFFYASQAATNVTSGATSDTISSSGYVFAYSLDKWWSATGLGPPTGRPVSITWPTGVEAQTQTAGPSGPISPQIPATITIKRVDGTPFDLTSFTAKILGNTAAAGASIEIMPVLNGIDGFADPLMFDATGYAGNTFSYSTPTLTGFDTYNISLWMDFGLTALTLVDPSIPPTLQISLTSSNYVRLYWPTQASGYSLQASSDLTPGHFTNTLAVPATGGAYQVLSVPVTNSQCFFRLAQ